ncbi:MAG: carboxypeptidase, partial [Alphaproteobacteria bacterium]|nr:carboxypeptidase [Alphaproteobacteria bacterium]
MHPAMAARKAPARLKLDPDDRPPWYFKSGGAAPEKPSGPPRRRRRWPRRLGYAGAILAVWGAIAFTIGIAYYAHDLPDVGKLGRIDRRPNVTLAAADGSTLANFGDLYGEWLTLDAVPPALIQAVLATEDRRFYSHPGIDVLGLTRAVIANLRAGRAVQ